MMRLRAFATLLTAVAGLGLIGMAQPAHAINIANWNQNPSTPPSPGFSIVSPGPNSFSGALIPIDYTFLVPPNNTTAFGGGGVIGTAKALLSITGGGLTGVASVDGSGNITQSVDFTFSIVNSNVAPLANANLLTGRLFGTLNVAGFNLTQATMNLLGLAWNSTVLYDVGSGPKLAQELAGYTASWTLNSAFAPINAVNGGQIAPVAFGGLTGGFAATPEPASMVMLGLGLAAIPAVGLIRRRLAKA